VPDVSFLPFGGRSPAEGELGGVGGTSWKMEG
jgi:hypothetical protein